MQLMQQLDQKSTTTNLPFSYSLKDQGSSFYVLSHVMSLGIVVDSSCSENPKTRFTWLCIYRRARYPTL